MKGSRQVLADQRFRNTGTVFATKLTPQEMQELEEILTQQSVQAQILEQTRIQEEMRVWAHAQAHAQAQALEEKRVQAQAWAHAQAQVWAQEDAQMQARAEAQMQKLEQLQLTMHALMEAQALTKAREEAQEQAEFALRVLGKKLVEEIFVF
jgi:glucose repression mediator protein